MSAATSSSTYAFKGASSPRAGGGGQAKSHEDIFTPPAWRDVWAAVLYYVSLAAFLGIAYINISYIFQKGRGAFSSDASAALIGILVAVTPSVFLSIGLAALLLYFAYKTPEGVIRGCYIGTSALGFAIGVMSIMMGGVMAGIFSILFAGLNLLFYFLWRKHIPFSATLLRWSTHTMFEYPGMIGANFGLMFILFIKIVVFGASLVGAVMMHQNRYRTEGYVKGTLIYSVFWFLWTEEIIQNVSRVTSSGVFACRYFLGLHSPQAPNPTVESFKRATTYSFGSICFGSLLVSFISFLRFLLDSSNDGNSIARALTDCLLSILESLLRYFNTYAFTQVAIYGKSYIEAAKSTWDLVNNSGVGAIINDNLIRSVLGLGSFVIGLVGGLSAVATFILYNGASEFRDYVMPFMFGTLASAVVSWCSLSIIGSGVTTFYVCLAEDPAALSRTDPDTYRKVASQYSFLAL